MSQQDIVVVEVVICHRRTIGDKTFAVAAPRLWNSLPSDIRQPDLSYGQSRRSFKTFLYRQ